MNNDNNMGSVIGSALIGAGGSLLGGVLNSFGQKSANRTNLQIARETNQANERLQDKQNEWNLNMWNMQNAYNDPSAQRNRLLAAGINPLNGDVSSMPAQQLTSANAQALPASIQNEMSGIGNGVAAASSVFTDMAIKQEQLKAMKLQNDNQEMQNNDFASDHSWKWDTWLYEEDSDLTPQQAYKMRMRDSFFKAQARQDAETAIAQMSAREKQETLDAVIQIANLGPDKEREAINLLKQQVFNAIEQGKSLKEDVVAKEFANELRTKYGLDLNADWLTALVGAALRNPHSIADIINSLFRTIGTSASDLFSSAVGAVKDKLKFW